MKAAMKARSQMGFALVATLSMMMLLVVVAIGLLSLSTVSLRAASVSSADDRARANARMALMLAIDQLQLTMGSDKRVSARAVTMAQHPALDASVNPLSAKAWWVGAASSDRDESIGAGSKSVVWFISGLNPLHSAEDQITSASPFTDREITMYGKKSIDLELTGGDEIVAGTVPIADGATGAITGSYAYFVDDNGMKAQLAASHARVKNATDVESNQIETVIPGSYDLSILDGMDGMEGVPVEDFMKLNSVNDLPLLGNNEVQISRDKRLSFTASSLGVLSNVKDGGLKKDLTIAFENHTVNSTTKYGRSYPNMPTYPVFDAAFPKTSDQDWGDYLLVDESKRSEFGEPGYIHWAMLRDYYNIKRYIIRQDGRDCLTPIAFNHVGMNGYLSNNGVSRGTLPPHEMGPAAVMPKDELDGMPYGDIQPLPNLYGNPHEENLEYYKHSPLVPVLAELKYNCWLEKAAATSAALPTTTEALRTKVQMWASHYNPYNIDLWFNAKNGASSYMMKNVCQVNFTIDQSQVSALDMPDEGNGSWKYSGSNIILPALLQKQDSRTYKVNTVEHLGPGRAMFCAFENDNELVSKNSVPGMTYGTNVRDLVTESIYRDWNVVGALPPTLNWKVDIIDTGLIMFGVANKDYFISQFLVDFMPKTAVNQGRYSFDELAPSVLNDNSKVCFSMRLRTTKEPGSSIRPLVDSNIRGFFVNRKWDQTLGTDVSASYTHTNSEDQADLGRVPQMSTQADGKGFGYWGGEHGPFHGNDRVILFDIPRQDLVSLGQLQHVGVGRFSYEPSYVIGNSYANPRIPLDNWKGILPATTGYKFNIPGPYTIYDASYLTNEALWDGYIFTTIPQVADNYDDSDEPEPDEERFAKLLNREELLPNPRIIPYEPSGSSFDMATLQFEGDNNQKSAFHTNAGHLLVDGAFNVNSTSVDAWEAFLSGTYGMPYQKVDDNGKVDGYELPDEGRVRFPRVQSVFGKDMTTKSPDENYWVGFRALEQEEVRELAVEIVNEIQERGPFLTMGEFVNRKLEEGELGQRGALQAALDKTVNKKALSDYDQRATHPAMPADSNQAAGFPGQLLQGDILQSLAPCMTVRSDTFTIRAYGESLKPGTSKVEARAWCEAEIQRFPDPMIVSGGGSHLDELAQPSSVFGRQFRITRFRWLNPNEI